MPHVSKQKLKKEAYDAIVSEFFRIFLKLSPVEANKDFLDEFFTPTERTMFAKRLAVIALLLKGMPPYHIQTRLKVSPSTIARLQLKIQNKQLGRVEAVLKNALNLRSFWEQLEKILYAGMPPIAGNRSKWWRERSPLS